MASLLGKHTRLEDSCSPYQGVRRKVDLDFLIIGQVFCYLQFLVFKKILLIRIPKFNEQKKPRKPSKQSDKQRISAVMLWGEMGADTGEKSHEVGCMYVTQSVYVHFCVRRGHLMDICTFSP